MTVPPLALLAPAPAPAPASTTPGGHAYAAYAVFATGDQRPAAGPSAFSTSIRIRADSGHGRTADDGLVVGLGRVTAGNGRATPAVHGVTTLCPRLPERERPADHAATVTCITRADIPAVAALAADHIRQHPTAQWLVPDPGERRRVLCGWYTILVEHALAYGQVDILTDRTAAAIWLDRTWPLPEPADYQRRLQKVCGEHVDSVTLLTDALDNHRPTVAHLHLAVLAAAQPGAAEARSRTDTCASTESASPGTRSPALRSTSACL